MALSFQNRVGYLCTGAGSAKSSDAHEKGAIESLEPRAMLAVDVLQWTTFPTDPFSKRIELGGQAFVTAVVADFDHDGRAEIAAAFRGDGPMPIPSVRFYQRGTDNTITEIPSRRITSAPGSLAAFDADNDGDTDLLIGSALALNDGTGSFSTPTAVLPDFPAPDPVQSIQPLHADADADTDLAVVLQSGSLRFFSNNGTGVFTLAGSLDQTSSFPRAAVLPAGAGRTTDSVLLHWGFGSATNTSAAYTLVGSAIIHTPLPATPGNDSAIVTADFTGDGIIDLLWSQSGGDFSTIAFIAPGRGDGSFAPAQFFREHTNPRHAVDLTGDGLPELYAYGQHLGGIFDPIVLVGGQRLDTPFVSTALLESIPGGRFSPPERGQIFFADWDGDGDKDLLRVLEIFVGDFAIGSFAWQRNDGLRTITDTPLSLPSPDLFAFNSYRGLMPTGRTIYADTNTNGRFDLSDRQTDQFGNALRMDNTNFNPGTQTFFGVAPDAADVLVASFRNWTSLFMAEGYRNVDFVNEYIPMVNANDFPVEFRVALHYASGERDQLIGSGTIAPHSRGGFSITERGRINDFLARPNEAYSVELQSTAFLGATFVHYDSFGAPGLGQATGESMTAGFTRSTTFADVSADDADYILFYAKNDTVITLRFFGDDGSLVTQVVGVAQMRRGGALVREVPGIRTGVRYAVSVESTADIIASLTNYASGRASLSFGGNVSNLAPVELRAGLSSLATFANTTDTIQTITLSFDLALGPVQTLTYNIRPNSRTDIDLGSLRPLGLTGLFSVRLSGNASVMHVTERDTTRRDQLRASARGAAREFLFAEGYMRQADAGRKYQDSIAVHNANDTTAHLQLRFFLPDGRTASTAVTVAPASGRILKLWEIPELMAFADLSWFATSLGSDISVSATFTHWDLTQPGGFATG